MTVVQAPKDVGSLFFISAPPLVIQLWETNVYQFFIIVMTQQCQVGKSDKYNHDESREKVLAPIPYPGSIDVHKPAAQISANTAEMIAAAHVVQILGFDSGDAKIHCPAKGMLAELGHPIGMFMKPFVTGFTAIAGNDVDGTMVAVKLLDGNQHVIEPGIHTTNFIIAMISEQVGETIKAVRQVVAAIIKQYFVCFTGMEIGEVKLAAVRRCTGKQLRSKTAGAGQQSVFQ